MNDDGGETYYAGTRTSPVFLRVYRKDVEAPGEYPPRSWRYELEAKAELADYLWHSQSSMLDRPETIRLLVASYFARWQLPTPWQDAEIAEGWVPRREPADAQRLERWLRTSVAPAIEKLMTCRTRQQILDALGLNSDVPESHN